MVTLLDAASSVDALKAARETDRQNRTGDRKFLQKLLYFFELRVPQHVSQSPENIYIYPLVLPPKSLTLTEPFAVEQHFTSKGGLYVEESGIIARTCTISGTTGWRPRLPSKAQSAFSGIAFPERRSYSRDNATRIQDLSVALSGQRHFQFLQDAVFRTYADLKRDPATSEGTELFFHVVKDDEHWRAVPLEFRLDRDGASPLLYNYTIQLLLVEGAQPKELDLSEDKEVVSTFLKDGFRVMKTAVQTVEAAVLDLARIQNELATRITHVTTLIDDIGAVAGAASAFLDGTTRLVNTPLNAVKSARDALTQALHAYDRAVTLGSGTAIPGSVLHTLRRLELAMDELAVYPATFQTSADAYIEKVLERSQLSVATTATRRQAAEDAGPPATLRAFQKLGTGLLPGDRVRADSELGLGQNIPRYTGSEQRIVEQGDTLATLAAKYLGDARRWKFLAVFNNLKPPYITEARLPGTLRIGDKILVPTFKTPAGGSPATLGVRPEEDPEVHLLGRDLELVPQQNGLFDFEVDVEGGSTDAKKVAGIANLKQAIRTRIVTERGTDILYKKLGTDRIVGMGVSAVDLEVAQFRIVSSVQNDPRIAAVRELKVDESVSSPDVIDVEIDAEVRGLTSAQRFRTSV